jgi:hypothetical protein
MFNFESGQKVRRGEVYDPSKFQSEIPPSEGTPESNSRKENITPVLERFLKGKLGKFGKFMSFLVLLNMGNILSGMEIRAGEKRTKVDVTSNEDDLDEVLPGVTEAEIKEVKKQLPTTVRTDERGVHLGFEKDSGHGEGERDEEVIKVSSGEVVVAEVAVGFPWAGRGYENDKIGPEEQEMIRAQIATVLDGTLGQFEGKGIELNDIVKQLKISGGVSSSSEGGYKANLELNKKRVEAAKKILSEEADQRGLNPSKVEIVIEDVGVEGKVTELADAFGVKGSDQQKTEAANDIIRSIHNGKMGEARYKIRKLTRQSFSDKQILDIYQKTIASHRRADLTIEVQTADVFIHVGVKPSEQQKAEEFVNQVGKEWIKYYAMKPEIKVDPYEKPPHEEHPQDGVRPRSDEPFYPGDGEEDSHPIPGSYDEESQQDDPGPEETPEERRKRKEAEEIIFRPTIGGKKIIPPSVPWTPIIPDKPPIFPPPPDDEDPPPPPPPPPTPGSFGGNIKKKQFPEPPPLKSQTSSKIRTKTLSTGGTRGKSTVGR